MKKKRTMLSLMFTMNIFITIICFVLGSLMKLSGIKRTVQDLTKVEIADFVENTRYSIHFGKSIASFYGMDEELKKCCETMNNADDMFIVDKKGKILFSTDKNKAKKIPESVRKMAVSENKFDMNNLYCVSELTDDANILTVRSSNDILKKWISSMSSLLVIAVSGMIVTVLLMLVFWKISRNDIRKKRRVFNILILWIVMFSIQVGYDNYREYKDALHQVRIILDDVIRDDIDAVTDIGLDVDNIPGEKEYLERYTKALDDVVKIWKIDYVDDKLICTFSKSYQYKMILDYVLQAFLFLTFSALIVAEYQIFSSGVSVNEIDVEKRT